MTTPATSSLPNTDSKLRSIALVLLCGSWYIGSSTGLIAFNKDLMNADKFPFPAALGLLHTSFCSLTVAILFLLKPGLFPSLTDPEKKVTIDGRMIGSVILVGVLFSAQIIMSNMAYMFADVAFLQMLKESNLVLVYLMSVAFGIEIFKTRQMLLVALIVMATVMSIHGEMHFNLYGFLLQAFSCVGESLKMTLTCLLMSSMGKGLDPLSYMLTVMPVCAVIFASTICCFKTLAPQQQMFPMPAANDWIQWKWMLMANMCVALSLNVATFVFIRVSSAVSFVLAGILKDVMIVIVGVIFMGHEISGQQASGFTLQVSLVLIWSLFKTFPQEFESGISGGLMLVLFGKIPGKEHLLEAEPKDLNGRPDNDVEYGSTKQVQSPSAGPVPATVTEGKA